MDAKQEKKLTETGGLPLPDGRVAASDLSGCLGDPNGSSETPTVFCDVLSKNAALVFSEADMNFAEFPEDADLLWMRKRKVFKPYMNQLEPYQLMNHLPGENALIDKGLLAGFLNDYDQVRRDDDVPKDSFYPETYRLYDELECQEFLSSLPATDSKERPWLLKPTNLSKGRGIRIIWEMDELREAYRDPDRPEPIAGLEPNCDYVVQRYVTDPLLLNQRKSEIRLYWLVANLDPLMVLVYKEGTVRLNTLPFTLDDLDNQLVHVTNVFQQKSHPDYDPTAVLKWRFDQLERYVVEELGLAAAGFLERELKPRLKQCLRFAIRATAPALSKTCGQGIYFGPYGADIILDSRLQPWLTEVQISPGLSFVDDPVKQHVIPPMLTGTAQIMFEVQRRKRRGLSLADFPDFEGYEWVINEA